MLIRTLVFFLPGMVLTGVILWRGALPVMTFANIGIPPDLARVARILLFTALFFVPARRGNGWRALHDLASGTRVVSQPTPDRRRVREPQLPLALRAPERRAHLGPFVVIADVGATDRGTLMLAFDPILRRNVWIHQRPPGDPATSATRRDVSRIGRLHWLAGQRYADDHWDAFEAPPGRPLVSRSRASRLADAEKVADGCGRRARRRGGRRDAARGQPRASLVARRRPCRAA